MKLAAKSVSLSYLCLVVLSVGSVLVDDKVHADQPNILVLYLDDFGWRDAGFMGSDFYETPNIDRLAADSLVFTNAYSCAANCSPARACLLSGQYTPRHQIFNVGTGPRGKTEHRRLLHVPGVDTLDTGIKTWAHQLQSVGYKTATIGKWHLSSDPLPYGFDVNIGGTHSGSPPNGYYPPHPNVPGLEDALADEYLTDRLSSEAVNFIRDNAERPWMLYLTHFAVHTPVQAKKELLGKYQLKKPGELHGDARMATMIEAVDEGVGQIVATLKELELADETVILFYSDNGGHGPVTDMKPLKGYKGTYYEGGIRVPFFVHWPGQVTAGENGTPITGVDFFPTLCEIAGAPLPPGQIQDGRSLVSLFKGRDDRLDERAIFWHFPAYLQSTGINDEQRDPLFRSRPCSVVRQGSWKLIQFFEDNGFELYDLSSDLGETTNLIEQEVAKANELKRVLAEWQLETRAPIPKQPNPEFDAAIDQRARQKPLKSFGVKSR